jgi:hypothetical protein
VTQAGGGGLERPSAASAPPLHASPLADSQRPALRLNFDDVTRVVEDGRGAQGSFELRAVRAAPAARTKQGAPSLGTPALQFEGGNASQRTARIVEDPARPGKRVLEFDVKAPNVRIARNGGMKSRIQMNVYDNVGVFDLYGSVRLRLDKDMATLRDYPGPIEWLTISEWWNNAGWTGEPNPFRISVHIKKPEPSSGRQLHFGIDASVKNPRKDRWSAPIWEHLDTKFDVPVETWMTVEYYFKDGDDRSGRFFMAVTPDGGQRTVVADITNFTRHPDEPRPDGLTHFNPMKLYTSGELTEFMRSRGKSLKLLWSDLYLAPCAASPTGQPSECARLAGSR